MTIIKEYAIPLVLTSPNVDGQKVNDAQWLMAGHSRFDGLATYKDGKIDGQYGLLSSQATKRTKFWLGYPLAACDGVFGQTLYEYLRTDQWRQLPKANQTRRTERLAAAAETPGTKAMDFLAQYLGYHESPAGSNDTIFGKDYGFNGVPWCAEFETYGFKHTGYTKFKYASCELMYLDARANRNGLRLVFSPKRGDINIFNLHGDEFAHTSFFDKYIDQAAGTFQDFGGNTGPADESNGGEVLRQERAISTVSHFVRVG